jgi:hypothetical protein
MQHGLGDFTTQVPIQYLAERVRTLFPSQAAKYQKSLDLAEAQTMMQGYEQVVRDRETHSANLQGYLEARAPLDRRRISGDLPPMRDVERAKGRRELSFSRERAVAPKNYPDVAPHIQSAELPDLADIKSTTDRDILN